MTQGFVLIPKSVVGRRHSFKRKRLPALATLMLCFAHLLLAGSPARAEPNAHEYEVKAAFVYNFAKFVDWPEQCFADAGSPIVIGVFGASPIGPELEKAVAGRKINGRPLVIRPVANAAAAKATQLLFVGAADEARLGDLHDALPWGVLTVGESEGFYQRGGMIVFQPEADRLRFEINVAAARQAGLKVSAQLQKLAKSVKKGPQ